LILVLFKLEKALMQENQSPNKAVHIDIKEIIRSKNPRLAKALPGFILRYIKRKLHQDEINTFLEKSKDIFGIDFVNAVLKLFNISDKVIGIENISKDKKYLFVANHPQGALESMSLISNVHKTIGETRFMVNDLLLNLKNFEPIFVPINLFGSQTKDAVRKFDEVFNSPYQVLYYPAGLVSRKIKGEIHDTEWKKSFINLALKHKRDIVPVYIEARNSNFFYRLANFRKFFGIKSNIEMFFLPDEMYKQKGKTYTLVFGEPVSYTSFDKTFSHAYWAHKMQNLVYSLKDNIV
jgi:1-acyl-sn-glycerol-3-phosphate acyltransferase